MVALSTARFIFVAMLLLRMPFITAIKSPASVTHNSVRMAPASSEVLPSCNTVPYR